MFHINLIIVLNNQSQSSCDLNHKAHINEIEIELR